MQLIRGELSALGGAALLSELLGYKMALGKCFAFAMIP